MVTQLIEKCHVQHLPQPTMALPTPPPMSSWKIQLEHMGHEVLESVESVEHNVDTMKRDR